MRRDFAKLIREEMRVNKNIILLTGDLGYGLFDGFDKEFPNQYYNVGSSEQLLLGIGIGISQQYKIPVCYSITPFLLYRPFELIRNYLGHENTPVKLVGSGRDREYSHDGFTHWAEDDLETLGLFTNIEIYVPDTIDMLKKDFKNFLYKEEPAYLSLSRFDK